MRPKQTTADDTDITDVLEAFVPNVCVGADPLGQRTLQHRDTATDDEFSECQLFILSSVIVRSASALSRFLCSWFPDSKDPCPSVGDRGFLDQMPTRKRQSS